MNSTIHIQSVAKRFGPLLVVSGAIPEVREKTFLSHLGPNGAGRSAVIKRIVYFQDVYQ